MRAEYVIGLELFVFMLGYLVGDLGAGRATRRRRHRARRPAPENTRKAW